MPAPSMLRRRLTLTLGTAAALTLALTACTSNEAPKDPTSAPGGSVSAPAPAPGGNDEPGKKITIGFSGPAADHGWLGAINKAAIAEAGRYPDVDLKVSEGTNDANLQISQVETFINDKVDAIVLLPTDGAALTDVAIKAMEAGIPVINVDREFSSTFAARVTVLGDNYGMGVSAGTYICERLGDKPDSVIAEIAGIDSLPLTQDRTKGFNDALAGCGLKVSNRVAADFTIQGGQAVTSQLLQAAQKIDAIWNHDDDQGIGVLAAIETAKRDEFFMVGGAGSKDVMELIKSGDSVMEATVIYPSTQAADGIRLARLVAQGRIMGDLVSGTIPRKVQLYAPVVTKDNVDDFIGAAFES
ncbi:substrate-binding domain-containing protein [Sanguibacter sp. HDW7]|uniref:substrate-binding domain-containing protein n=1 Tax=Sanguibacter sp. HDW7 TaxID=2714931 RepID=UPI00140BAD3A|nr:substrate-binding domain-containing protein [Sanguibacter sp. HDW7]QIK83958.1 substrate-binding domain-containing protein [Sanguibacter sp. HDW7]